MIFIDTSAYYALYKIDDKHHQIALKIARNILSSTSKHITTNIIITECLTLISMRVSKEKSLQLGKMILESTTQIVFIDQYYHQKAFGIFQTIKDKNISFADCTSFAVMRYLGIKKAFSFDNDFKKYGFELLKI